MDKNTEQLYEEAYAAMRKNRQMSERLTAATCIIGGSAFAGVMALALWLGSSLGSGS